MAQKIGNKHPVISIPVNVYDLDGNFLTSYDSINMAARILKLNEGRVWKCVKEGRGRSGQYQIREKISNMQEGMQAITGPIGSCKTLGTAKEVDVYDLDGNFLRSYDSINMALKDLHLGWGRVSECLKKGVGRTGQYQIRYKSPEKYALERTPIGPYKADNMPKEVNIYDLSGKRLMTCKSISEASRKLNTHIYSIRKCVQGRYLRAGQYIIRKVKKPRKIANAPSDQKLILTRVDYIESGAKTGILYRLVPYTGENRCVKCAFAQDASNCIKAKCTTPDGKNGYFRFFCDASRKDYFVAQV